MGDKSVGRRKREEEEERLVKQRRHEMTLLQPASHYRQDLAHATAVSECETDLHTRSGHVE